MGQPDPAERRSDPTPRGGVRRQAQNPRGTVLHAAEVARRARDRTAKDHRQFEERVAEQGVDDRRPAEQRGHPGGGRPGAEPGDRAERCRSGQVQEGGRPENKVRRMDVLLVFLVDFVWVQFKFFFVSYFFINFLSSSVLYQLCH